MIDLGSWLPFWAVGLLPILWKYSFGALAVAGSLAFAWFSPVFKKTALWVASGIAIGIICYATGVNDGEARIYKRWDAELMATIDSAEKARKDAEESVAPVGPDDRAVRVPNDKWDRDQH
jgi:hypothetical protein